MTAVHVKKLLPGVTMRFGVRGRSIRYDAMIRGRRFVGRCTLPIDLMVNPKNGKATQALVADYSKWVAEQSHSAGTTAEEVAFHDPTIEEVVDAYEKIAWARNADPAFGDPSERTINNALKNIQYCIEASGLAVTRPFSELVEPVMLRKIFAGLCAGRKPITAWSYFTALQSITANWTLAKYYDLGFDVKQPNLKLVDVGHAKNVAKYKSLPQEQKDKIFRWYSTLEEKLGKEIKLAAMMTLELGMRPEDVCSLTAANFPVDQNGTRRLRYRPSKTYSRSGREVDIALTPELWSQIRHLSEDKLAAGTAFVGNRRTVYGKINQSMRYACDMAVEDGWNKAVYELRKLCYDIIWHDPQRGPDVAVALSGENRSTLEKFYADPYSVRHQMGGNAAMLAAAAAKRD